MARACEYRAFAAVCTFLDSFEPTPQQLEQFLHELRQLPEPSWLIDPGVSSTELALSLVQLQQLRLQWRDDPTAAHHLLQDMMRLTDDQLGIGDWLTEEVWIDAQRYLIGWMTQLDARLRSRQALGHSAQEIERFFTMLEQLAEADSQAIRSEVAAWKQRPQDFGPQRQRALRQRLSRYLGFAISVDRDTQALTPAMIHKLDEAHWHRRQLMELLQLRLGLELYRCQHGCHPQRRGELAGKYSQIIPPDRFQPQPLTYAVDDQWVVLYSVGRNGWDEGGRALKAQPPGDDIVIRWRPRWPLSRQQ